MAVRRAYGNRVDQRRRGAGDRLSVCPRPRHADSDHGRHRAAARHGILIKDAEALERAHEVDNVVFDKTGTLTSGTPRITHFSALDGDENTLLTLAGALQRGSEHPLAKAVLDAAAERELPVPDVSDSQS